MNTSNQITLFTSKDSWIEGESMRQLERVASLPGMLRVVGLPDLHPGKGSPVGAAMLSEGEFYPYLVGSDVGCGMGVFATEISAAKAKPEKWSRKLRDLEEPWDGDAEGWLADRGVTKVGFHDALGTIGLGNHFAELLRVHDVLDQEAFQKLGLENDRLALLVHSGSRGLGASLLREHTDQFRDGSLKAGSEAAVIYLDKHANALSWAEASRELIAHRFLEQVDSEYRKVIDLCHNSVMMTGSEGGQLFLHRKGAAPSNQGAVVIPGSRGALSYLVMPINEHESNLWSVAHGAGRKWNRSECEGRLREKYSSDSLRRTKLGSYVVCEDKKLLYEEAPQAYKEIETVIGDLVSFGLVKVIASLSPLLTYKVREK